jgi:uncharacterized SAM-binding protein YcdF (DUF218 family)
MAVVLGIVTCLVFVCVFHELILVAMAKWLDVGERPRPVDFVMVLPGGPEQRPFVAVSLVRAGLAKGILTAKTEIIPESGESLVPTADDLMKRVLKRRGIQEDQIHILPGQSKSTWTDALALSHFMHDHPTTTVAIVTDCYHTRRSRWVFRRVLGSQSGRLHFISAPLDRVSPESWWTTEEGLTTYLAEYSKLMVYVGTDRTVVMISAGLGLAFVIAAIGAQWRRKALPSKCVT